MDAVDEATGTPTKFTSLPLGTRAIELPDAEYQNYFLKTFGKPVRASVCECERSPDESLSQALHTLNGDIVTGKIGDRRPDGSPGSWPPKTSPETNRRRNLPGHALALSDGGRTAERGPLPQREPEARANATRTCNGPSSTPKSFCSCIEPLGLRIDSKGPE